VLAHRWIALAVALFVGALAPRTSAAQALAGDVNGDGVVSAADAQAILSFAVGLPLPSGFNALNGDANCDAATTALDAQIVLSYAVGNSVSQFCVAQPRTAPLRTDSLSIAPYHVATFYYHLGGLASGPTTYTGAFGSAQVHFAVVDDTTIAVMTPELPPAQQVEVTVLLGSVTGKATLGVSAAAAPVANPGAYLDTQMDAADVFANALESRLTAPGAGTTVDTLGLRKEVATIRAAIANARTQLASASPSELAAAANQYQAIDQTLAALGTFDGTPARTADPVSGSALGHLARTAYDESPVSAECLDENGQPIETNEECLAELDRYTRTAISNLAFAAAVSAALSAITSSTVVGVAAAAASAVKLHKELSAVTDALWRRFAKPGILKGTGASGEEPGRLANSLSRLSSGTSNLSLSSTNAPETFTSGEERALAVQAQYRSVTIGDAANPQLSDVLSLAHTVDVIVGSIRSALHLDPIAPLVPATPATVVTANVPPKFLSLASVSPASITGTSTVTGAGATAQWNVTLNDATATDDETGSMDIRYSPPGTGPATITVPITLHPVANRTLTIGPSSLSFGVGDVAPLIGEVRDANHVLVPGIVITWTSGNPAVASITADGVVTGVSPGATTITAKAGILTATMPLIVTGPATSLAISIPQAWTYTDHEFEVMAVPRDAAGHKASDCALVWSVTPSERATVTRTSDTTGTLRGSSPGQATLNATCGSLAGHTDVRVDDQFQLWYPGQLTAFNTATPINVGPWSAPVSYDLLDPNWLWTYPAPFAVQVTGGDPSIAVITAEVGSYPTPSLHVKPMSDGVVTIRLVANGATSAPYTFKITGPKSASGTIDIPGGNAIAPIGGQTLVTANVSMDVPNGVADSWIDAELILPANGLDRVQSCVAHAVAQPLNLPFDPAKFPKTFVATCVVPVSAVSYSWTGAGPAAGTLKITANVVDANTGETITRTASVQVLVSNP
jgi:hypothetical protein